MKRTNSTNGNKGSEMKAVRQQNDPRLRMAGRGVADAICRSGTALGYLAPLLALAGVSAARAQAPVAAPATTAPPATTAAPATTPATATSASSAAAPVWHPDNRLIISGDGESLTGTNGGGGGSLEYLGEVNANTLLGVAGEYQTLAGSHWEFGSLNVAYSHPLTQSTRWDISGEAHEGSGQSGTTHFGYAIEALGAGLALPDGVALTAEERQVDVDTSHGSLPKIGLSKVWGTHWLTSVGYADSIGGNLNTEYGVARIDFLSAPIQLMAGGSVGRVAPAVLNIEGVLLPEAHHVTEVFAGVTKPTRHVDITLLGDRIDLQGVDRFTVTLTATVHFR
jgi:hypothetical protein